MPIQEIGPASTPQLYFENQFRLSQQQLSQRYKNLQRQYQAQQIDYESAMKEHADMQAEADAQTEAFQSSMQMMQQSQQFVDIGRITPEQHQEAMWEQVLPKEVFEKLYAQPEEESARVPFSPKQVEDYRDLAGAFMSKKSILEKKIGVFGWDWIKRDVRGRTQESLLKKYEAWQQSIGYYSPEMDFTRRRQADYAWDSWAAEKGYDWNPNNEKVKALRATGPLTRSFGEQFRGTPTGPREATNPLQVSIAADLPKRQEPKPEPQPQPRIWARNPKTKKRLFSTDGGKTWQSE